MKTNIIFNALMATVLFAIGCAGDNEKSDGGDDSGFAECVSPEASGYVGSTVPSEVNGEPSALEFVGLLDDDDIIDLGISSQRPNDNGSDFYILSGKGDGTFAAPKLIALGEGGYNFELVDFDNDKKSDMFVDDGDELVLFKRTGETAFQEKVRLDLSPHRSTAYAIGDINGDKVPDIIWTKTTTYDDKTIMHVHLSKGPWLYAEPVVYEYNVAPLDIWLADVDGDGDIDVSMPRDTQRNIAINDGKHGFTQLIKADTSAKYEFADATLDVNGDKKPDIIKLSCFRQVGETMHTCPFQPGLDAPTFDFRMFDWGDINDDGTIDLVEGLIYPSKDSKNYAVHHALQNSDHTWTVGNDKGVCLPGLTRGVQGADLNRDGKVDYINLVDGAGIYTLVSK